MSSYAPFDRPLVQQLGAFNRAIAGRTDHPFGLRRHIDLFPTDRRPVNAIWSLGALIQLKR